MDLIEFLNARLDEEEEVARAASPGGWRRDGINSVEDSGGRLVIYGDGSAPAGAQAEHIVRHDPARVLRDVEVMRRMVDFFAPYVNGGDGFAAAAGFALRTVALPYDQHEDYRDEWRP